MRDVSAVFFLKKKQQVTKFIIAAFEDIVSRNLIEIRKYGFGDSYETDSKLGWTPTQFWAIVKLLTNKMSVQYNPTLFVDSA